MGSKSNNWLDTAARRYEICRLKYVPSDKRFLQLKDGAETGISAEEIARLYTLEALEMLGSYPNTWCVIMEQDEEEPVPADEPAIGTFNSPEYLAWRRSLLPALILRSPVWTA
jgi:hypothetical protein